MPSLNPYVPCRSENARRFKVENFKVLRTEVYTQRKELRKLLKNKCSNYTFPIDLAPIKIPFSAKSIGKIRFNVTKFKIKFYLCRSTIRNTVILKLREELHIQYTCIHEWEGYRCSR